MVCILERMGRKNYLIEGLSGTGKTSLCDELQRRGHHAIHGDRELAYQGDPETGEPTEGGGHEHHIWDLDKVKALVTDTAEAAPFFCGGSRNFSAFVDLFDGVFVLEVDLATLNRRVGWRNADGTRTHRPMASDERRPPGKRRCHRRHRTYRTRCQRHSSSVPPQVVGPEISGSSITVAICIIRSRGRRAFRRSSSR
jgi:hypothetical protein